MRNRAMASLDTAYAEVAARSKSLASNTQKQMRLVADPAISAHQIEDILTQYAVFKGSVDFWSLIAPPPNAPQKYNFKTQPHHSWINKTVGLVFDLLDIASNTKLVSVKVQKALYAMIEKKSIVVPLQMKPDHYVDKIDVAIRVIMAMIRKLKGSVEHKTKLTRLLSAAEKSKLELVLNKVVLPSNYVDDEEEEGSAELLPSQVCLADNLALVPTFDSISLPDVFTKIQRMSFDVSGRSSAATAPLPMRSSSSTFDDLLEEAKTFVPQAALLKTKKKKDVAVTSAEAVKKDLLLGHLSLTPRNKGVEHATKAMFVNGVIFNV